MKLKCFESTDSNGTEQYLIDCFRAYLEYDIQEWVVDSGDDDDFCSYGEREDEW